MSDRMPLFRAIEMQCQVLAPLLDQSKGAIAAENMEELETCMGRVDAVLAEIGRLSALDTESAVTSDDQAAVEHLASVLRTVLHDVDAGRARLEDWKDRVQGSLGHLNAGGQAIGRYAAAGQLSNESFRVRA